MGKNQIDFMNKIFREKEEIPKDFCKLLRVGKTNLYENRLLFLELVVLDEEDKFKKIVLMLSKTKAKFLMQRLLNPKYGLVEEEKSGEKNK